MFKPGDLVQLKSGGPVMTVKEAKDGKTAAVWFPNSEEIKTQIFVDETLKHA